MSQIPRYAFPDWSRQKQFVARIIVNRSSSNNDLCECFGDALGLLKARRSHRTCRHKAEMSKYGVIVVEDKHLLLAIERLRGSSMQASFDR